MITVGLYGRRDNVIQNLGNIDEVTYERTDEFYTYGKLNATGYDHNNNFIETDIPMFAYVSTDKGSTFYIVNEFSKDNDNKIRLTAKDLKSILDIDYLFDFTQSNKNTLTLFQVMSAVCLKIKENYSNEFTIDASFANETALANIKIVEVIEAVDTYFIANAYNFVKTILALNDAYMEGEFVVSTSGTVTIRLKFKTLKADNPNSPSHVDRHFYFTLPDFDYEKASAPNVINKATGTIKTDVIPRPTTQEVTYYLGNDNKIYENTIPANKRLFPIRNKIYEDESLVKAQLNALMEIASNRYPFNYTIKQSEFNPFDLSEFKMGDHVNSIPISEIKYKNGEVDSIKLGFKKMLLTEVINGTKEKQIFNVR